MSDTAFDSKAFIQSRNGGKPVEPPLKPAAEVVNPPVDADDDDDSPGVKTFNRSQRRLIAREAEERGRRLALEEILKNGYAKPQPEAKPVEKKAEDPEPQRKDFQDDATYNRALGRWDARQEAAKEVGKVREEQKIAQETDQLRATLQESHAKFIEDRKKFADWDEKAKLAEDLPLDATADAKLLYCIARSDQQAGIYYYFADKPEEWDAMRNLAASGSDDFIPKFHRLEGKVEKMYSDNKAAEASEAKPEKEAPKKERLPETRATAADRDVRKPRPSTEVSARGGSPPPEEPVIGSPAWMARRNQIQFGR